MKKFVVRVRQTLEKEFRIEASSLEDAKKIVTGKIASGDLVLGLEDQSDMSCYAIQDDCIEDGGEYVVSYFGIRKTVPIIDEFESRNEDGTKKYRRLMLKNFTTCRFSQSGDAWVSLIVERIAYDTDTAGDVTFSQLKVEGRYEVVKYINECLKGLRNDAVLTDGGEVIFKTPYRLRAQTSGDRMPGGWEYGTRYGDAHDYGIVGVKFSK